MIGKNFLKISKLGYILKLLETGKREKVEGLISNVCSPYRTKP